MNNKSKTIVNILKVSISNIIKLLSGVLVGFLLPKIIGVEDYGLFKTFTLYGTYTGLFAIGITDGVYLKYGGYEYKDLDRERFRLYTKIYILMEMIFSMIIVLLSFFLFENEMCFIMVSISIFMFVNNLTGYYQIVSQITGRFNEFSLRTIIQSILTTIAILTLWAINKFGGVVITYKIYTIIYVSIVMVLAIWYVSTYRDITFGKTASWINNKQDYFGFMKLGIPLLVANLCSSFILTLDRQFVNLLFDTKTYAIYAFAYNMLALITTALSAISTVIYPVMKKMDKKKLMLNYDLFVFVILVIVFGCLVVYFPLLWFVKWFLPKYEDSLQIFRIILPGISISSSISIVMHNYYKTLDIEKIYFSKSIIVLVVSAIANYFAYLMFKTTVSISIASILVMAFWYVYAEHSIPLEFSTLRKKNYFFLIAMVAGFYMITVLSNWIFAMISYIAYFLSFVFVLYHKDYKKVKALI